MYTVDVSWCKKIGIRDRAQKANELMKKDKSFEQYMVMRPGTETGYVVAG